MTTDHAPATESAPTAAAEPTTEIPPATHAAAELAWSVDTEPAEVEPPSTTSRLVWSALVALVVALAGALIFLGTTLFGSHDSKPVEQSAKPTTTVQVAAPPPPAVTVTAAPPAPSTTVAAAPADRDAAFVAKVAPMLPPKYNDGLPTVAQDVCADIARGQSEYQVIESFKSKHSDDASLTWDGLHFFVTNAVQTYCPENAGKLPSRDGD
jgi:Protein of unknown function (DUF732)